MEEQISSLRQLPHLKHVVLRFDRRLEHPAWDGSFGLEENLEWRLKVLKWFFSSLVSSPAKPRSLAIRNMHYINPDHEVLAMITEAMQGLRALRLNIANETYEPSGDYWVSRRFLNLSGEY